MDMVFSQLQLTRPENFVRKRLFKVVERSDAHPAVHFSLTEKTCGLIAASEKAASTLPAVVLGIV
jgi:hypothetical protein